jgi:methionine-S-sulfoxide reductase
VGYAGGTSQAPTYRAIGDHVECVQVEFDPDVVSYEELLEVFWAAHDPTDKPYANQYSSLVLTATDAQLAAARASARRVEQTSSGAVLTRIQPLARFYPAEDYHQKYELRNERRLMTEFASMFPDDTDFVDSTAAARVNGLLGGFGSETLIERELGAYGLSERARERVRKLAESGGVECALPAQ